MHHVHIMHFLVVCVLNASVAALLPCRTVSFFAGCCISEAACAPSFSFDKLLPLQADACVLARAAAAMSPMPNKNLSQDFLG